MADADEADKANKANLTDVADKANKENKAIATHNAKLVVDETNEIVKVE